MLNEIRNFDAAKITLTNSREGDRMGNPINGRYAYSVQEWDSEIGTIKLGINESDSTKAILLVRHGEIPSHIPERELHHWGFLGLCEIATDMVMTKRLFHSQSQVDEEKVLNLVRDTFARWADNLKANENSPFEIPCTIDGEDNPHSNDHPNPGIDMNTLPIKYHANDGSTTFSFDPAYTFHLARFENESNYRHDPIVRVEVSVNGWYNNEDGTWDEVMNTSTRYMQQGFARMAGDLYQQVRAHEAQEAAREANRVVGGLGRVFV